MINEKDIRKRYLGIPYKHLGRDLTGIDCWFLIMDAYKFFKGIDVIDINCYGSFGSVPPDFKIEDYYKDWEQHGAPVLFDLLIFKNSASGLHAGLYLSKGEYIHACRAGVVIARIGDKRWNNELIGIFRHKG